MEIRPVGDRVLVRPIATEHDTVKNGIVLPKTAQPNGPQEGTIIAVGPKVQNLKSGERALLPLFGSVAVRLGEETLQLLREDEVLAVLV